MGKKIDGVYWPTIRVFLGPPGSGKTTSIIKDMERIARERKVDLFEVAKEAAILTFNRSMAYSIVSKLEKAMGRKIPVKYRHRFGTIHSYCYHSLGIKPKEMMTTEDFKHCFAVLRGEGNLTQAERNEVELGAILRNTPSMKDIVGLRVCSETLYTWSEFLFRREYFKTLREKWGKVDYTDLLEYRASDRRCEEGVSYCYVDEAQDLTTLQWAVIFTAFKHVEDLVICGDPMQSIYKFMGADTDMAGYFFNGVAPLGPTHRLPWKNLMWVLVNFYRGHDDFRMYPTAVTDREGRVEYCPSIDEMLELIPTEAHRGKYTFMILGRTNAILRPVVEQLRLRGELVFRGSLDMGADEDFMKKTWDVKRVGGGAVPKITVSTFHQAKGLEADVVIVIPDMGKKAYCESPHISDELKCWYVACTRSKLHLAIAAPKTPYFHPIASRDRCVRLYNAYKSVFDKYDVRDLNVDLDKGTAELKEKAISFKAQETQIHKWLSRHLVVNELQEGELF